MQPSVLIYWYFFWEALNRLWHTKRVGSQAVNLRPHSPYRHLVVLESYGLDDNLTFLEIGGFHIDDCGVCVSGEALIFDEV